MTKLEKLGSSLILIVFILLFFLFFTSCTSRYVEIHIAIPAEEVVAQSDTEVIFSYDNKYYIRNKETIEVINEQGREHYMLVILQRRRLDLY